MLVSSTLWAGCVPAHKGIRLKSNHGAKFGADLGVANDKQALTRVEWTAGGSSNQCLPTVKLAVLGDGTVYCWRRAKVNGQCPEPFKHQGQIPAQEAQTLVRDTRDELRASDPEDNTGCVGGWSSIRLLDQENRRYYSIDLSCQHGSLMQQNSQRIQDIWKQVCDGKVGPEES